MARDVRMPWMSPEEIVRMNELLEERRPAYCLEWGAGGSTVYWPSRYPFIRLWVSVEHDEDWYNRMRGLVGANVKLLHLPVDSEEYCSPAVLRLGGNRKYDFILVDGRRRVECLRVASRLVKRDGVVVLHDAGRLHYRPGWEFFSERRLLTEGEIPLPDGGYKHRGLMVFRR